MYSVTTDYLNAFKAPARRVTGSIVCKTSNNKIINIEPEGNLISFKIEKTAPQGKLFGFAVSQKITIEALGAIELQKGDRLTPSIQSKDYAMSVSTFPYFYVDTVEINKVKNTTIIVGYDLLHKLDSVSIDSIEFTYPIHAMDYAYNIVNSVGGTLDFKGIVQEIPAEPNLNGNESARSVLAALAEFTASICYISRDNKVCFRGIKQEEPLMTLEPDCYFDLSIGKTITLTKIASGTELGDNVGHGTEGFTQILWENPFLTNRENIESILTTIGNKVINTSCTAYTLNWRGCPAYEIGDYLIIKDKANQQHYVRYFNETIEYNGGLKSVSEWQATESESVDLAPSNLTNKMKVTSAKVDKVNQEIELVAKNVDGALQEMAQIKLTTDSIVSTVEILGQVTDNNSTQIENLSTKLDQTADSIKIEVKKEILEEGLTDHITTATGFTFNEEGLTIDKTGSEMSTQITEDGMTIYRNEDPILVADNQGVYAANLNATTFLIIGDNSRFEDYNNRQRTGCFWIGGV